METIDNDKFSLEELQELRKKRGERLKGVLDGATVIAGDSAPAIPLELLQHIDPDRVPENWRALEEVGLIDSDGKILWELTEEDKVGLTAAGGEPMKAAFESLRVF